MDESSLFSVADYLGDLLLIMEKNDIPFEVWQPKKLKSKLDKLSRFFNEHYGNKTLVPDAAAVTSAAVEAQVILKDFIYNIQVNRHKRRGFFNRAISSGNDAKAQKNFNKKMELIKRVINRVLDDTCSRTTTNTSNADSSTTKGGESDDDDILFVGREKDIQVIQDKLISGKTDIFGIISIEGIAGIGKTCLARKIYNNHQVRTHFDCLAWVCARRSGTGELLKAITEQVMDGGGQQQLLQEEDQFGFTLSEEAKIFIIRNTLFDFLAEKRYLIVIDGIQTNKTWSDLGGAFPRGSANGSRVLLTTCNTTVVLAAEYNNFFSHPTEECLNPYRLRPLNDAESWEMFSKKVSLPLDLLSSYKNEIVKKCDGLPLAILRLANLLSKEKNITNKADHEGFQLVLDSIVDTNDCLGRPWTSHIVDTIVSDLPDHLKRCLFYFRYFPKYSKIPSRRLIALWVAEELVKGTEFIEPEVVAKGYLEELINWNIIEVVKYGCNQRPKKCCLTYFLREHLLITSTILSIKQHNQASTSSNRSSSSRIILRQADHAHNDEVMTSPEHNRSLLRSFLSFDYRDGPGPGERIRNFLNGPAINKGCFRWLTVLDLERVYKPVLPMEIGKLIHLRYLGLRWTDLETLPSSILNLKKLQTLDIKHTYINTLPQPLWDLDDLQHLYLNEIQTARLPFKLRTLWGIFFGQEYWSASLSHMKLTQLGLTCHLPSDDQERLANSILRQDRLERLRLTSKDKFSKPFILRLKHFTNHRDLSDLYLFGRLEKLLMANEFPPNLTVLTLSASNLKEDPMPTLGMLPKLTILKLYADTYVGKRMVCSLSSEFLKLQILKIWKLRQLEEWVVEEGTMPVLRKLEIRACNSLSKLPDRFLEITTLEELKISDMPREFTAVVKQNKDKEWYKKGNVCFIDWENRNSSIEASSSSTFTSSPSFASIALLFFLLGQLSASSTKHSTRVQGLPALGGVRY